MSTRPAKKTDKKPDDLGSRLKALGVFRTADAVAAGISQPTLSRMVKRGELERLQYGIYIHSEAPWPDEMEFIESCLRVGEKAAIGGLSALFYYGLCEQVPTQTWLVVPTSGRGKFPKYRIIYSGHDPNIEINEHNGWRIVSLERSIIEAFVYHTKIGYQTALTAARRAIAEGKSSEDKLEKAASGMGLWPILAKNWEAITTT